MDLRKFEAGASVTPPTAPGSPSTGYASAGDAGSAIPASKPGPYFFHQIAEETRNLIVGAGLTPDHNSLSQMLAAVKALSAILPLAALPFPTVATANNLVGATVASEGGAGGKVSLPATVRIALGVEDVAGVSGRQKMFTTAAWTSASLLVSSTYYLRAYVDGSGALVPYVQRGTDGDATPGGLVGTVNGAAGGGFDSTVLDVLLAKVVTGVSGSTPTLTQLANAARLRAVTELSSVVSSVSAWTALGSALTLNWARTPAVSTIALSGLRTNNAAFPAAISDYGAAGDFGSVAVRLSGVSRYTVTPQYSYDDSTGTAGVVQHITLLEA